ncbi:MAG: pyridoxal-5-phosphate-dependent protein subunit beta [Bdellovibrionales bacterium RIFOXYB1_FULL_37_110]|nr:MAG: pyridoxal-5-phosphate-dependent protein subunit beta [Bdellovibrionales bacterium RIFOXYC1_FULL_37_79]OFZ57131.1 MAG: pyridoxal-5-phosphate-dependent protein subunit beta [Bdellovibrionales bacterium RIFOXYB1_FULL_37_110]OFZ65385.1 MAG: pyridoxal-5-phosphate-dependent protein subunit beta [Bdellovibrionales bacterium RIFOXYD1_FULL_36_51]
MIDLTINKSKRDQNAKRLKSLGVTLPTFKEMKNPETIDQKIKDELKNIGLWDIHPKNLYRITWKNEQKEKGGGYGKTNYLVLPPELTGIKANIIALVGRWFPTGAHKVGATYGCLAPRLITGQFDPENEKAVWPSTGNYCRGGAYVSALLGCQSIAILPQEMSKERFEWLSKIAGEVIATPGCESNVKEIFDKCWELRKTRKNIQIFNQFEEFGNPLWHYHVTGSAMEDALKAEMKPGNTLRGAVSSSGSAGTMAYGYYLKTKYPQMKLAAAEALQCPTLLNNGFGGHRIEGIGDKHIPWIHDMKNTDMVIAVDDEATIRALRLFNEEKGRRQLLENGVPKKLVETLNSLGISSIGNLLATIKMAKYYEMNENDYLVTIFTDSLDLYGSRLKELTDERGTYQEKNAHMDVEMIRQQGIDNMLELSHYDKKRVHNLKYFTWIEQQQRQLSELNDQWFNHDNYWGSVFNKVDKIDEMILEFNDIIRRF